MNNDYADLSYARREWHPDTYPYGSGTEWNGSPVDAVDASRAGVPSVPHLDSGWDPVEELSYLFQEAVSAEQTAVVPPPRRESSPDVNFTERMEDPATVTAQVRPIRRSSVGHRKSRAGKRRLKWLQTGSFVIVAFVAVIVAMVSVFGGMVAYAPLQNISSGTTSGMIPQWPLLVYGPWMVASLSILRTALHRRRAVHSWAIVLLFSSVAIMLCVAQADRTFTGIAGAALPALASLACFQQLVRQITLTMPPRQVPRHRQ
jgi:hypothetical protein